jgi:inorganic pyrophosphatase
MTSVTTLERGCRNALDYRMFFQKDGKFISPWHDIPLYSDKDKKIFNMICEIPRWTNAKLEISTKEKLNPLKQDIKNDKLRYVNNVFPHHGYIWNYGAFPQTWEDPHHIDKDTNAKGDNDPIDVLEIGERVADRGEIIQVKVLGTLALIDEEETDWKIVTINVNDPLAPKLNDINDVNVHLPGLLNATVEWFKIYKVPTGKPENKFAFGGSFKPRDYALKVIQETNDFWRKLVVQEKHPLLNAGAVAEECINRVNDSEAAAFVQACGECGLERPIPDEVHKWHYIVKQQ